MSQAAFTRPSRYRSLLAPASSGTTRYSTTSSSTKMSTPRRAGLASTGSQIRQICQRRHMPPKYPYFRRHIVLAARWAYPVPRRSP
jgi:hypothetical protein